MDTALEERELSPELTEKLHLLEDILRKMESVTVAFSAGVDSTFLLYMAHRVLGGQAAAITATSPLFPEDEGVEAEAFTAEHGIIHHVFSFQPLGLPCFEENPQDRCYYCKTALFREIRWYAEESCYAYVAEGTNVDDLGDYRPGLRALEEQKIRSPLREAGLTKADVRALSRHFGLSTWDKPSFACLATRFPFGDEITEERLSMVGQAEAYLKSLGLRQYRVRIHDLIARIEVEPQDLERLAAPGVREPLVEHFQSLGFRYVTLDLAGYRSGSMNPVSNEVPETEAPETEAQ